MERIISACIKQGDTLHKGKSHVEIMNDIFKRTREIIDPFDKESRGFYTSENRFVSREEGSRIAFEAGQITERISRLTSEMIDF